METLKTVAVRLVKEEQGQNLIEYALIAGVIGLGAVTAMTTLKNGIGNAFSSIVTQLSSAV